MSLVPNAVAGSGDLPDSYYFALKDDPGLFQTLSLSSNTISISGGNSINVANATTVSTSATKLTAQAYISGLNITNFTSEVRSEGQIISFNPLGAGTVSLDGLQAKVDIQANIGNPSIKLTKPSGSASIVYDGTHINMSSLHVSTLHADKAVLSTVRMNYEVLDSFGSPGAAGQQLQSSGPGLPVVWGAGSGVGLTAVVAGSNISVDNTNPIAPIINLSTSVEIPYSITCSTVNAVSTLSMIGDEAVKLITPNTVIGIDETAASAFVFAPAGIYLSTGTLTVTNNTSNALSFNLGTFAVLGDAQVGGTNIDGILRVYDAANNYNTTVLPSSILFNGSNISGGTEVGIKHVDPYKLELTADDSALPAKITLDGQNGAMRLQAALNDAQINFNSVNGGSIVDGIKISAGDNPGRVEISTNRILLQTAQNGGDSITLDLDSSNPVASLNTLLPFNITVGSIPINAQYGASITTATGPIDIKSQDPAAPAPITIQTLDTSVAQPTSGNNGTLLLSGNTATLSAYDNLQPSAASVAVSGTGVVTANLANGLNFIMDGTTNEATTTLARLKVNSGIVEGVELGYSGSNNYVRGYSLPFYVSQSAALEPTDNMIFDTIGDGTGGIAINSSEYFDVNATQSARITSASNVSLTATNASANTNVTITATDNNGTSQISINPTTETSIIANGGTPVMIQTVGSVNKLIQTDTVTRITGDEGAAARATLEFYDSGTSQSNSFVYQPTQYTLEGNFSQIRTTTGAVEGIEIGSDTMVNYVRGMGLEFKVSASQSTQDSNFMYIYPNSGLLTLAAESNIYLSTQSITSFANTFLLNSDLEIKGSSASINFYNTSNVQQATINYAEINDKLTVTCDNLVFDTTQNRLQMENGLGSILSANNLPVSLRRYDATGTTLLTQMNLENNGGVTIGDGTSTAASLSIQNSNGSIASFTKNAGNSLVINNPSQLTSMTSGSHAVVCGSNASLNMNTITNNVFLDANGGTCGLQLSPSINQLYATGGADVAISSSNSGTGKASFVRSDSTNGSVTINTDNTTGKLVFNGTALQSATSSGSAGTHLVITLNGNVYKIKLENP